MKRIIYNRHLRKVTNRGKVRIEERSCYYDDTELCLQSIG